MNPCDTYGTDPSKLSESVQELLEGISTDTKSIDNIVRVVEAFEAGEPFALFDKQQFQNLCESLYAARAYIIFVGLNRTELGEPHPQEFLLANMEKSLTDLGIDFE